MTTRDQGAVRHLSRVEMATIGAVETGITRSTFPTRSRLRDALEAAGADFTRDGVRLRSPEALEGKPIVPDSRPAPTITHLLALAQKKGFVGRHTTSWNELMKVWNEASDEERAQVIAEALRRKRS